MVNQRSSVFCSDHGHCLQIHHLWNSSCSLCCPQTTELLQGEASDTDVDRRSEGEVEGKRVWRANLAVGILIYSSKNYCICCGIFICFAEIFLFKCWTMFFNLIEKCLPLHFSIILLAMENENLLCKMRDVSKWKMIQFDIIVGLEASIMHNAYKNVQFLCLVQILQMKH